MAAAEKEAKSESSQAEEKDGAKSEGEPTEPTGYVRCPVEGCGEVVAAQGRYGHFKSAHPNKDYENYKEDFEIAPPPEERDGEEKPSETSAGRPEELYETEPDSNKLLKKILNSHPGIGEEPATEVMWWARHRGDLHPTEVYNLLSNLKGVSQQTATLASQKYAAVLQSETKKQGGSGGMPVTGGMQIPNPRSQNQGNPFPIGTPQQDNNPGSMAMPQSSPSSPSSPPQSSQNQHLTEERLREILEEREEKKEEREQENQMMEMVSRQQQLLENLNKRLTAIEEGDISGAMGASEGENGSSINETLEELKAVNETINDLSGEEKESMPPELQATLTNINKRLGDLDSSPEGEINQYSMEVEQAKQQAQARKTEAEEQRKGFEAVADGIRGLGDNLGWSIGESIAKGGSSSPSSEKSNPGSGQGNPQTQMQNQDLFEPKPIRKREDGTRVLEGCVYKDCDFEDDIEVEEGKSTTTCPKCNRVITIPAVE